jgi:hypothetical protein
LDRTYIENCPEYGRILDRRMTEIRPEDKAYGKKSLQNIGQEDGKILNRRQNILERVMQNIGQEGGRMWAGRQILYKRKEENCTGGLQNIRQGDARMLDRKTT